MYSFQRLLFCNLCNWYVKKIVCITECRQKISAQTTIARNDPDICVPVHVKTFVSNSVLTFFSTMFFAAVPFPVLLRRK